MIRLDAGVGVVAVSGLDRELAARLCEEWRPFVLDGGAGEAIEVEVSREAPVEGGGPYAAAGVAASFDRGGARYAMDEGTANVPAEGSARIALGARGADVQFWTLLTLLGAVLAWRAPARGALVLHGAGLVLDGRAFVLVGAEGSGKTTFARLAAEARIPILGDDLVVVRSGAGGVEAAGSPLRSRPFSSTGPGRWPLAAILLPEHALAASLAPVSALAARARTVASLPFVAEGMDACPGLEATLDAVLLNAPARTLRFAPDPGFLDLLRTFVP